MSNYTTRERKIATRYTTSMLIALGLYAAAVIIVVMTVNFATAGPWKYLVAAVPLVPGLLMVRAVARLMQSVDEMQRLRLISGLAVGFGVAMVAAVTLGWLILAGLNVGLIAPWLIFMAGMLGWALSGFWTVRR